MPDRPLIVLSLEGLATSALGCYGSSWNHTPAIDAIAGNGCVWDRCIATSDDPNAILREIIDPRDVGDAGISGDRDWAENWRKRGVVDLLTDSLLRSRAFRKRASIAFSLWQFDEPSPSDLPVTEIDRSQLGQLFAAAIERDGEDEPWSVLWLHSGFLTRTWDAPRDLFPIDEVDDSTAPPSEDVELLEAEPAHRTNTRKSTTNL